MKTFKEYVKEGEVISFPKNKVKGSDYIKAYDKHKELSGDQTTHFKNWTKSNLKKSDGHSVTATDAYSNYVSHAENHKVEPHDFPTFSKHMNDTGIIKQKVAGRIRYIGVKLPNDN
jgi:hypothetical protein